MNVPTDFRVTAAANVSRWMRISKVSWSAAARTCRRHGLLHWKVPSSAVSLKTERVLLSTYAWRDITGAHHFCPTCGTSILRTGYADGKISINARCNEEIDVFSLEVRRYDGRKDIPPGVLP